MVILQITKGNKMAIKSKNGEWINASGQTVPPAYISKHDKDRDRLVEKNFKKAIALNKKMKAVKDDLNKDIEAYIEAKSKEHGINSDWKGNLTLSGFSGTIQIEVDVKQLIHFDDKLQIAKRMLEEYMQSLDGSNKIKAILNNAYKLDKNRDINRAQLKNLCNLDIKDEQWVKAIALIRESEKVVGSKQYTVFRYRDSPKGEWQILNLNFSSLGNK